MKDPSWQMCVGNQLGNYIVIWQALLAAECTGNRINSNQAIVSPLIIVLITAAQDYEINKLYCCSVVASAGHCFIAGTGYI